MMTVVILFKNGTEVRVKCESVDISKSISGDLSRLYFRNAEENCPLWADLGEVLCVYRV